MAQNNDDHKAMIDKTMIGHIEYLQSALREIGTVVLLALSGFIEDRVPWKGKTK